MRESDKQFLEIISCAIRGRKFKCDECESINWREVLLQSIDHNVTGLVYYGLDKSIKNKIHKDIIEEFKRYTFLSAVFQKKSDIQIKNILIELKKDNLSPIILKGHCLKELYPFPELRTMKDLDLLIHTNEFKRAQMIMEQIGYKRIKGEGGHLEYAKKGAINIELHLAHHFKGKREYEEVFWNDCLDFRVLDTEVNIMSFEDNLVYLCIHMAKHMLISSIGIRQLCDFTLFIEKHYSNINWDKFFEKINIYGLKEFFLVMTKICINTLELKVPYDGKIELKTNENSYENLIIYILDCGVFGKKNIRVLDSITDKYCNKKNYKFLLFIDWVREIITLFRKKERIINLLKAPFIVFIYRIKRRRICRRIYL